MSMSLPVALLAGGLATRLRPLTEKTPKSLIQIGNDYFISHQLHYLRQQGISQVVLCVGHLGQQIEAIVGDGTRYGLEVSYSWDGPNLLGTGGALKKALPLLGQAFFILYGDSYLPISFPAVSESFFMSGKKALMTVFKNKNQGDQSNVIFQKNQIIEYNKHNPKPAMDYIDYGLNLLSAAVFDAIPANTVFDLATLFHDLAKSQALAGFEVFESFYEIGSWQGLSKAREKFRLG